MNPIREDPLETPVQQMILHCGGMTQTRRIRGQLRRAPERCAQKAIVPARILADFELLRTELEVAGWSLAVGQARLEGQAPPAESEVRDGKLVVPGEAVYDTLCAACARALMDRMAPAH